MSRLLSEETLFRRKLRRFLTKILRKPPVRGEALAGYTRAIDDVRAWLKEDA